MPASRPNYSRLTVEDWSHISLAVGLALGSGRAPPGSAIAGFLKAGFEDFDPDTFDNLNIFDKENYSSP